MSGSLSFSYTGAGATSATSFNASGTVPTGVGANLGSASWAAGGVSQTSDFAVVLASVPRGSTSWDLITIGIGRKTVGTSTIDPTCALEQDCTGVFVNFDTEEATQASFFCELSTGSVTITAISSTNITGTFSGSGTCFATTTGAETPFTVTNGSFNVGVTTQLSD